MAEHLFSKYHRFVPVLYREAILKRKKLFRMYIYFGIAAFVLLLLRQFLPGISSDKRFLFFMWNLTLAFIPLVISTILLYTESMEADGKRLLLLGALWLLFFPNAPYILTDYVHVKDGDRTYFLLDFITWAYFSIVSFSMALISLEDMFLVLARKYGKGLVSLFIPALCLLIGFGIYLGRDLRFNSWDVFTKPKQVIVESVQTFHNPPEADFFNWVAASSISLLLYVLFLIIRFTKNNDQKMK